MNFIRLLSSIRSSSCNVLPSCYFSQHPLKYLEMQNKWKEQDGISKNYQLIYKAPMDKALNFATTYLTFSTTTVTCLGAYYAAFVFDSTDMNKPIVISEDIVIANSGTECFTYLAAFVLFHAAVKILLSKYVVRLYQNNDKYVAVYRGHLYNSIEKHDFDIKDVKKLKPTMIVSWGDSRFSLGARHAILLENYFKTPEYYNRLVGKQENEENP